MQERIIVASLLNGSELLKSLAKNGVNTINMRITNSSELARLACIKSAVSMKEQFIDAKEECVLIAKAVEDSTYFGKPSYSDIQTITKAIKTLRMIATEQQEDTQITEALRKGIFREKNEALISVYQNYMAMLKEKGYADSASLVRFASGLKTAFTSEFIVLEEYPLLPLELELVKNLSSGTYRTMSLRELYETEEKQPICVEWYKNCYGANNEAEMVLDDIYRNHNLDTCIIAVADPATYSQLFFNCSLLHDIPVTFGTGIPITNSYPAQLLNLYYKWMTDGFFGKTALKEMIFSHTFDREKLEKDLECENLNALLEIAGNLRLENNYDKNAEIIIDFKESLKIEEEIIPEGTRKVRKKLEETKELYPCLDKLSEVLSMNAEDFINTYATVRKTGNSLLMQLDNSAKTSIYRELATIRNAGFGETIKEVIPTVLSTNVCKQISESGRIHITDLKGALNTVRDNLYIVGFSATNYPGAPKENYLLLDDDFDQFENTKPLTSEGEVNKRKDTFRSLLQTYSNQNSKIHISYAGYNASELKKDNPSSLMFEVYRKEYGENATLEDMKNSILTVGYFDPGISMTREIGKAFVDGTEIVPSDKQEEVAEDIVSGNLEKEYSPSALECFFKCEKMFLLKCVLGIPEPEEDKLFEIIPAIEQGTIAHTMMEIRTSEESEEKFLEIAGKYFDVYVKQHRPVVADKVDIEKNRFLDMMKNGFNMETENGIAEIKEEEIHCVHTETGICLHGYPDKVEMDGSSGKRTIVDYKTGSTVKHVENDLDTCLQGILYAYMLETNGKSVDHIEYRYIRFGKTVCCNYDESMKERLTEKLNTFKNVLESGEFSFPTDNKPCEYCKYKDICGK